MKFDDVIRKSAKARKRCNDVEVAQRTERRKQLIHLQRLVGFRAKHKHTRHEDHEMHGKPVDSHDHSTPLSPRSSASTEAEAEAEIRAERLAKKKERQKKKQHGPLRADMIRRMDQPAVLLNPMGGISTMVPSQESVVEGENGVKKDVTRTGYDEVDSKVADHAVAEEKTKQDTGDSRQGVEGILSSASDADETPNVPNIRIAEPPASPTSLRKIPSIARSSSSERDLRSRGSHSERRASVVRSSSPERMSDAEEHNLRLSLSDSSRRLRTHTSVEGDRRSRRGRADEADGSDIHEDHSNSYRHIRHGSDVPSSRPQLRTDMFPRAQTIEFADTPRPQHGAGRSTAVPGAAGNYASQDSTLRYRTPNLDMDRTPTMATSRSGNRRPTGIPMTRTQTTSKRSGFGGFPTPVEIVGSVVEKAFPAFQKKLQRTTTLGRTATYASGWSTGATSLDGGSIRPAPYLSFDAMVSRNSRFHELTEAQRDELGGVEYRAIDLLAKLLPLYVLLVNFFFIVLVAPWLASGSGSSKKVQSVVAAQTPNAVSTTWMWFFQVISAYSNTGLSLIDTSMTQLPTQYFMLIPMAFLILVGNTAYPVFLRFVIWVLSLCVPKTSRTFETLRFLLDHPRRCFVYLFPSAQTWFLLLVVIVLNCTDWIFFQILDLGNSTIESWSVGQRIFDGLFQSIAVRAAGFQVISLLEVAPAVQFLFIVMMYISVYPIAMSVRNTNVYEEKSLGIYNDEDPEAAPEPLSMDSGARVWGTYLASHARRQLAFDMWWLGFALWLICIIERSNIENPASNGWFTVFSCLFELTSAYGTVGLSTGTPYDNFSLSGRFSTLSKLVVIAVMLRGRHRGLPVAIDRAVMLPDELQMEDHRQDSQLPMDTDDDSFLTRNALAMTETTDVDEPDILEPIARIPTGQSSTRIRRWTSRDKPASYMDADSRSADTQPEPLNASLPPTHLSAIREAVYTPTPNETSGSDKHPDSSNSSDKQLSNVGSDKGKAKHAKSVSRQQEDMFADRYGSGRELEAMD